MASVIVLTNPPSDIEYSINGPVRAVELRGKVIYDRSKGIAVDGWQKMLADFVKEQKLDVDKGMGLRAFIYWMRDEGLL